MEEQSKQYIKSIYRDAYQKFYYAKQTNKQDNVLFYDGQCKLLLDKFSNQLGTDSEIQELKDYAISEVDSILDFYNS